MEQRLTGSALSGLDAVRREELMGLYVDYQVVGRASRFEVPVTADERCRLHVGSRVRLIGDGVADVFGVVRSLHATLDVEVEIDEGSLQLVGSSTRAGYEVEQIK